MKKVLYIFGQLNDQDIEWLVANGQKLRLKTGDVLVAKGAENRYLYIILEGSFAVLAGKDDSFKVASLGSGEIVGEMSFVDGTPPQTTVKAEMASDVFAIPKSRIEANIAANQGFGLRLYRALSLFLANRLRETTNKYSGNDQSENADDGALDIDELDTITADSVAEAGNRFSRLLAKMQAL